MGLLYGTRRALLGLKERWLLRDEFTDTRAAGAVNGTPATPGPGTRVVTDADSVLSVAGGSFVWAQWIISRNTLLYSAPVIPRVAGRMLLSSLTLTGGNQFVWGLDDTGVVPGVGSGEVQVRCQGAMVAIRLIDDGANNVNLDRVWPALGVAQKTCLVLRAAGVYLFWNESGTWKLEQMRTGGTDTPLYLYWSNFTTTLVDSDGTAGWLRVPEVLWLPTPAAYDSFTRADGALGSSEATGPDGQSVTARAWANRVGTTEVVGNVAQATALVGGIAIATVDTATADVVLSATLTRAGNEVGIVLRYADADNYIRAIHDGTNCQLIKRVGGVETTVITAVVAIGAGALVVICSGTSFSLYLNNAQVGATSAIADAALQTGTQQGLYSTNVGNTQDAVLVFPRGTGNEYAALDRWSS